MKKIWPLAVLGILAYIIFAIATLPAKFLVAKLAPFITAAGVEGTVWNGQAQVVQQGPMQIGSVAWKVQALPLLAAKLKADVRINRPDGFGHATIAKGFFSDRLVFTDLTASLPVTALAVRGGWTGTVNARLPHLSVANGWPTEVEGRIEVMDLAGPSNRPVSLGSYKVEFPPGSSGNELVGALADTGGPLEVAGNVQLKADRSYKVEGVVAARPDAPKNIADSLKFLGEPDAQGRRPFGTEGTL